MPVTQAEMVRHWDIWFRHEDWGSFGIRIVPPTRFPTVSWTIYTASLSLSLSLADGRGSLRATEERVLFSTLRDARGLHWIERDSRL